jgi:outer membrane protein OmpA-like peptidoglycan-associated protein
VTEASFANVVSNGLQNFNTTTSGINFLTVQSAETLEEGIVNLGVFVNSAINTLPYNDTGAQSISKFNDNLIGADINIGYGLAKNWEIGLSAPFILLQSVNEKSIYHGQFNNSGNTEVRAMTKYRFWDGQNSGMAAVVSVNLNRTKNNPYLGVGAGPTTNVEMAYEIKIRQWAFGYNLGFRKAKTGTAVVGSNIEPVEDQIIYSGAVSRHSSAIDTKFILEVFGSQPKQSESTNPDRQASSLEVIGGLKHDWNHNLALQAGAGSELLHGVSSPDFRIYAGLNYTFGSRTNRIQKIETIQDIASVRLRVRGVQFDFDSDNLTPDSEKLIDEVIKDIKLAKAKKVIIVGHTDSIGKWEYNQKLSTIRAQRIKDYFRAKGVLAESQLEVVGQGEDDPIADNGNFQGRQENRRVEFLLTEI